MSGSLTFTFESLLDPPSPDFPNYTYEVIFGGQSFDFDRNLYYHPIYSSSTGKGGISVVDLNTMQTLANVSFDSMYAGTPYGEIPGFPPTQSADSFLCGDGTDLYLGMGSSLFYKRFTRIDANTMKVTGEWYLGTGFPPPIKNIVTTLGAVNKSSSRTVVAYASPLLSNPGTGIELFDGTAVTLIGQAADMTYNNGNNVRIMAGNSYETSCDFIVLQGDEFSVIPYVDIWVINVTDGGVITSTKTGTFDCTPYFPLTTDPLWVGQIWFDAAHDCIISSFTNQFISGVAPQWFFSLNYDGSVNWTTGQLDIGVQSTYSKGQSRLLGTRLMFGGGTQIYALDTRTGAVEFQGGFAVPSSASFFTAFNSDNNTYYTYSLAQGFVRYSYTFIPPPPPPGPFESYFTFITCCDRAIMAHLYQFTSATGEQDYFTDFDIDINLLGQIWKSDSLRFEGLQRKLSVGLAVDEQTLKIWATPEDTIFGGSFLSGAEEGLLDGVLIQRSRVVWQFVTGNVARDIQNAPAAIWPLFTGYMGAIEKGGTSHVEFKVKSALVKLNVNMPRNYYQPSCLWTLFDQGCGLSKSDFAVNGTITSATYNSVTLSGGVGVATGGDGLPNFAQGRLLFTSGVNSGLQVFINTNDSSTLFLAYPLSAIPSSGDTVTFWPGCSKTFDTCHKKFNNTSHIRNFDKVPPVVMSV